MTNEKYLFFRSVVDEDTLGTADSSILIPVSAVTAMVPAGTTTLRIAFNSLKNQLSSPTSGSEVISDYVNLTLSTANTHHDVTAAIMRAINGSDNFIVIADDVTTFTDNTTRGSGEYIHPNVTACDIYVADTLDYDVAIARTGTQGASKWHSYSAGAVAATTPAYSQTRVGKEIISTIEIDLENLRVKGSTKGDAIALVGGSDGDYAFIAKYLQADMGVLYKAEAICMEVPAGTGTITTDIDFAFHSSKAKEFDSLVQSTPQINVGASMGTLNNSVTVNLESNPSDGDFLYIVEGDTTANDSTTNTYTAGKIALRLFGRVLY